MLQCQSAHRAPRFQFSSSKIVDSRPFLAKFLWPNLSAAVLPELDNFIGIVLLAFVLPTTWPRRELISMFRTFHFLPFQLIQRSLVAYEQYAVFSCGTRLWSQDGPENTADCSSVPILGGLRGDETVKKLSDSSSQLESGYRWAGNSD